MTVDGAVTEWTDERIAPDGALVHKQHPDAVLVRRAVRVGPNSFVSQVRLPPHDEHYGSSPLDLLFLAEAVRQATVFISHAWYDVPLGHQFLMPAISVSLSPDAHADFDSTVEIRIGVRTSEKRGVVRALETQIAIHVGDIEAGMATTKALIVDPNVYRRLRARAQSPATSQVSLGDVGRQRLDEGLQSSQRLDSADRLIIPDVGLPNQYILRVDTTDSFYFDHKLDHVPGMLILSAGCQAVLAFDGAPTGPIRSVHMSFSRTIELNSCTTVTVRPEHESANFLVDFTQGGDVCASGIFALQPGRSSPVAQRPRK